MQPELSKVIVATFTEAHELDLAFVATRRFECFAYQHVEAKTSDARDSRFFRGAGCSTLCGCFA
jgi:hypothetical protein